MADPLSLAIVSIAPVVVSTLLASVGLTMALIGKLNKEGMSAMAQMAFYVFSPALVSTTIIEAVSIQTIQHLWPILVQMTVGIFFGMVVGYIISRLPWCKTPKHCQQVVMASCAFGNIGNLPLVFSEALCNEPSAPFAKQLGSSCKKLGIAYTGFNMSAATIFQFTLGVSMLRRPANAPTNDDSQGQMMLTPNPSVSDLRRDMSQELELEPLRLNSPPSPLSEISVDRSYNGQNQKHTEGETPRLNGSLEDEPSASEIKRKQKDFNLETIGAHLSSMFPFPSRVTLVSILIGCIAPIKGLLIGPSPPLRVVTEALQLLGEGLIPTALPLLGAVLSKGPGKSCLPWQTIVAVAVVKLIIIPLCMTGFAVLLLQIGIFELPDIMSLLIMLLSNAMPGAINLQTIAVLHGYGEAEMSTILFPQYIAALITLPLFVSLFLRIIDVYIS